MSYENKSFDRNAVSVVKSNRQIKEEIKNFNLGINILLENPDKRMEYFDKYSSGKIDKGVEGLIKYVGDVIMFLSCFMNFIKNVTQEINDKPLSPEMIKKIQEIVGPDADPKNMFELSKLIRYTVQEYAVVTLISMAALQSVRGKVNKLHKTLSLYQRMKKAKYPVSKMTKLFKIEELEKHFQNLQSVSTKGCTLANIFFDSYQSFASVPEALKDYIDRRKKLEDKLETKLLEMGDIIKDKAITEANINSQEKLEKIYNDYSKQFSGDSTNQKATWEKITNDGIEKAKDEKNKSEERLRRYTYRMYGVFTGVWKNDVNLAENEVNKWTSELNRLFAEKKNGFQDNSKIQAEKYYQKSFEARKLVDQYNGELKVIVSREEKLNSEILSMKENLEKLDSRKKELFTDLGQENDSVDRLIKAVDATSAFASGAVDQAIGQKVYTAICGDSVLTTFLPFEGLLDDEVDNIGEQIDWIDEIEKECQGDGLLTFLSDSKTLSSYPLLEDKQLKQIENSMPCNLRLMNSKTSPQAIENSAP